MIQEIEQQAAAELAKTGRVPLPAPLWDRLIAMSHEGLAQVARDRV